MGPDDWRPRDPTLLDAFEAWRRGDHAVAEEQFTLAVQDRGHDPDAWRGLGSAQWSQRRFPDCLRSFLVALTLDGSDPVAWSNVGLANRDLGRRAHAIHVFEVALALDPGHAPAYNEWANVLVDAGEYNAAVPLYGCALELVGDRPVYHHNLGVCLRLQGDDDAALMCFQRALWLDPDFGWSQQEITRIQGLQRP